MLFPPAQHHIAGHGPLILDGRTLRDKGATRLRARLAKNGASPALAIIQVGDVAESTAYINQKKKFGADVGVRVLHPLFPFSVSERELISEIQKLNADETVSGIIVQLPIPEQLNTQRVIDAIAPAKDSDGLTSENKRRFEAGKRDAVVPATARGVLSLLSGYGIGVRGKRATVIGRSESVGLPVATLLAREGASVTSCDEHTLDVPVKSRAADILVVAIGVPRFITREYVSEGQVVVDIGINAVGSRAPEDEASRRRLVGDVDFDSVKDTVAAISPVPGGVGPMTVLSLFENLFDAARANR